MAQIEALQNWLQQPERDFAQNLAFGIKLLQSLEFPTESKYQVLAEYFCEKLPKFRKEIIKTERFDDWEIVTKFLSLPQPKTSQHQAKIIETVCKELRKLPPHETVIGTILTLLNSFRAYFKFANTEYGKLVSHSLSYMAQFEVVPATELLQDLGKYVKGARINTQFRDIFFSEILQPLAALAGKSTAVKDSAMAFIQQLFFTQENYEKYTLVVDGVADDEVLNVFDPKLSRAALLLVVESYFKAYQIANSTFVEFLFQNLYRRDGTLEVSDCLYAINEIFKMLKVYSIKIERHGKADDFNIIGFLREEMEQICGDFYEEHLEAVLNLVITTVDYNPLIMERKAFAVLANCMFMDKSDDIQSRYEEFAKSIIRMTNGLRRGEIFVIYLIKAVREKLESFKIPKTLKRKQEEVQGGKRLKLEDGKFKDIKFAWPYNATETEFTNLILLLSSKQSIYLWRLLSEFLNEELTEFDATNENKLFLVELISAVLCQFLSNTTLAESSHLYWDVIDERCMYMRTVLTLFGTKILGVEHNRRLMNSFLCLCTELASFESILWYYCPDSMIDAINASKKNQSLLAYLTTEEWKLIEQRVKNFGEFECTKNLNWVNFVKIRSSLVFDGAPKKPKLCEDEEIFAKVLEDQSVNEWLVRHLDRSQMFQLVVKIAATQPELLVNPVLHQNAVFLEAATVSIFQVVLQSSPIDFSKIIDGDQDSFAKQILAYTAAPTCEIPEGSLEILRKLPIGFLSTDSKMFIFGLLIAAANGKNQPLISELVLALVALEECPNILKYYTLTDIRRVFNDDCFDHVWDELLSSLAFQMTEETVEAFKRNIKRFKKEGQEMVSSATKLLKCLSTVRFTKTKIISKEDIEKMEHKLADLVYEYLSQAGEMNEAVFEETFEMFQTLLKSYIKRKNKTDDQVVAHNALLNVYLDFMFKVNSSGLIVIAILLLDNKSKFKLEDTTIQKLLGIIWTAFLAGNATNLGKMAALIYDFKSKDDLDKLLSTVKSLDQHTVCRIYKTFADHAITRSQTALALEKNSIFAIHYKGTLAQPIMPEVLAAHIAVARNSRIPVSAELTEDLLNDLLRVQIKHFKVNATNVTAFIELHQLMAELMYLLINVRGESTLNFLQSFLMVFENLLAAISLYRSDRPENEPLTNSEISLVADLTHKLEKIANVLVNKDKAVKLAAPFLISSVITCMVSNKRSTTLHEKVKNIFKNICFDLISAIDDHHHQFILRSADDATRDIYGMLYKEYKKFREFRGKV